MSRTSGRVFIERAITLALAAGAGVGSVSAQDVWVGTPSGALFKGDAHTGGFQWIGGGCGGCAGPVQSMVESCGTVFIGDQTGNIYRMDPATSAIGYAYTVGNDALSLVADGADLLIGGTDGPILRVIALTGSALGILPNPFNSSVDAMAIDAAELSLGSANSLFAHGDAPTANFQILGACGGSIQSMARRGDELFLGDLSGKIYRYHFITQQLDYAYNVPSDNQAMVVDGSHLLVAGSNGDVVRVNSFNGAVVSTWSLGLPISALAIGPPPTDPGVHSCFGVACPCNNFDGDGGCENSTGEGALLAGTGSTSVVSDDLVLRVEFLPPNVLSRMYMSQAQGQVPFGDGLNCAGGGGYPSFRFPAFSSGAGGVLVTGPGIASSSANLFGPAGTISGGSNWSFQAWYRNQNGPCGSNFNTSSAYTITFSN